ncbi:MAG: outer membrane lipid asymmetry maintenance protein MlaD [Pseudomonadota bacterium]|uniref:outer membrane lipid asymmetry maintenance protein MlaD n=1 Tax=Thermithiobacillus tepidarius TaxID=929 RepID=UPI00048F7F66|nr:outer membrane lipid asymmetry maintenance protein MlaD [Thermithiobacillus tepidarius]
MERKAVDWWVGIFVLLGLAALVVLALRVGNLADLGTRGGYPIVATFDNVGGLKVKAPVKMGGVPVGRVQSISIDPQSYLAVVRMEIEPGIKLPTDTGASIYTAGLLGEQYVTLEPGGSPDYLKPNGRISLTQSAISLEQIIGQFLYSKAAETPASPGSQAGGEGL